MFYNPRCFGWSKRNESRLQLFPSPAVKAGVLCGGFLTRANEEGKKDRGTCICGKLPKRIFFHKNTHFTEQEIAGCQDAFGNQIQVELIQIIRSSVWRAVRIDDNRVISKHPCFRGTYLPLSNRECVLWLQGAVNLTTDSNYFKEAYSVPKSVLIKRYLGNANWHEICSGILGLTKMDWNNNLLYKSLPITLTYSQKFAQIIQNHDIPFGETYNYIYFM